MKKLNKAMSVAVAAAMMVSLGACGNSTDAAKDGTQSAGASGKVYNIGICQQLEHPALDQATQGFEDVLKEKLGDNVKFDLQNAQNEQANASTIANNFVSSNVDLILANATTALQACAAATTDIPILGTSVTDYATALEIDDWSGTTGRNISGTSDLAPLDQQEDMLVELYPDAKHVAILYCSAEANSKYQATEFEKYLDEDGISYKEFTASDSNDIGSVVQSATEYADVIYIPTDNTMAQNTEAINNIALPAGTPIIAGEEGICKGCGVATLSISYYDIGKKAGEMAYDILVNGAGKSTTLNAVAGVWPVDSGKIYIGGEDVTKLSEHRRAQYLGRVFQDPMTGTATTMSIEENMAIAARRGKSRGLRWGITKAEREKYRQMLSTLHLGLEDRLTSKVGLLSGGQRQAITLLMASIQKPKLLLLDEHTAALDPKTAAKVLEISDQIISENHLTAMMVTHNMKDAIAHGNRLIMMHEGKVILNIAGEDKKKLTVGDLLHQFEKVSGEEFASDKALLS